RFRLAYFASAPTVRFVRAIERLGRLSANQRLRIAADVFAEIEPLVGSRNIEELAGAARSAQDARWRLIYCGTREPSDHLDSTAIADTWTLRSVELPRAASPVEELLARKRRSAVEEFVWDNLRSESSEMVRLEVMQQPDQTHPVRAAA